MRVEMVFSLAKLDALTAQLHLVVLAADTIDDASRILANKVARLGHATNSSSFSPQPRGIFDKDGSRLASILAVCAGHDRAFHEGLADNANGNQHVVNSSIYNPAQAACRGGDVS
jgi:hypothetical protein